jgi:quercetin dioxygenase-like cupin family protein
MEWELVRPGVKRKVFQTEKCTVVLNSLDPGHEPRPHSHGHEQVVCIQEGKAEFTINSKVFTMGPGSLLVVPPNAEHFIRVMGDKACINLDIFVPRREDYLQSKMRGANRC